MKILIAEDDITAQRVLSALVSKWGHEVVSASDGDQAWKLLQAEDGPRLALLDWMMPGPSGLDVCRNIRSRKTTHYTYVIILTARSDSQNAVMALDAGADDFVSKPFHPHELRARINTAQRILELEESLSKRAFYDPMTGLPNRSLLEERFRRSAETATRNGEMLAVIYFDIEHFKTINDTLGHAAGDALLKELACRLRGCVPDTDTLARVGGDEFVFLAAVRTSAEAAALAARVRSTLSIPIEAKGHCLKPGASIGISLFPQNGDNLEVLLQNADQAMYEYKRRRLSTGFYFFNEEVGARYRYRLRLENKLPDALLNNEFVVHYQPIFRVSDWGLAGSEALVRWQEPELGLIPPGEFIPIAEKTGQIAAIDQWVLEQACKYARTCERSAEADFRIAVNISGNQFCDGTLIQTVSDVLDRTGVNPGLLELELTETALVRDLEKSAATIWSLRNLGVRVALDDFGTGYSSFSYLANLPINTLKIDKSFLQNVHSHNGRFAVVKAIVDLSHKLGIMVVAEGIEDTRQLRATENAGCDEVQGFLLGRPALAEQRNGVCVPDMAADLRALAMNLGAPLEGDAIDRPAVYPS